MSIVLSNAGPLITLAKLNRLELLETLYLQVQVPRAVYTEVVTQGFRHGAPDARQINIYPPLITDFTLCSCIGSFVVLYFSNYFIFI